jgi:hypothetical protein
MRAGLTRENMLAVALNMGNEANGTRLLTGFTPDGKRVTPEEVKEVLGKLTEKDSGSCRSCGIIWNPSKTK